MLDRSLHGGFVVYSKEHKVLALGVSHSLLQTRGSVNAQVAQQLAQGALARSEATLALGVTGVLGPNPDEDGAQPGELFVALSERSRSVRVMGEHFRFDDPDEVRRAMIRRALTTLYEPTATPGAV